jgi:extradiol dioxygenase family protein
MHIFHLAIPSHDLEASTAFYVGALNAKPTRRDEVSQTFNFLGHRLVCRFDGSDTPPAEPLRTSARCHFGLIMRERDAIELAHKACGMHGVRHLSDLTWGSEDKPDRHLTFWVIDPSGNLLEFKWYVALDFVY